MKKQTMGLGKQITCLVVAIGILMFIAAVSLAITRIKVSLTDSTKIKITQVVDYAYNVVEGYKKRADEGEFTEAQAKTLALKDIERFRDKDSANYVWVNTYDYKYILHPTIAYGFDGQKLVDKTGRHFLVEIVDLAKSGKPGFIEYETTKPGFSQNKMFPKLSTAKGFNDWGWSIGTGVYTDDINSMVLKTFFEMFFAILIALVIIVAVVQVTFVRRITLAMNKITEELANASGQISEASFHLESSSQKLAEGSTEQAASIQEVSATLEETSSMVQKNSENTDQAATLARQAKGNADKSYKKMAEMVDSMEKIKNSSNDISKIIKVIDGIAFQTNILALNAAVEAARAGDAGKGFAVVAEEVRNLAQRTTQSAKDTTELIENNIEYSDEGVEIAKTVYESISEIDSEAKKVSDLLDEISAATNEQSIGVSQIHRAITQMEEVMHSSVQTADDTASASQELFAQTSSMNEVVTQITTLVNGKENSRSTNNTQQIIQANKPRTTMLSGNLSDF